MTVVNRGHSAWSGTIDGTEVAAGAASVSWFAAEPGGAVKAALLHGDHARAGALRSSRGQTAIVEMGDAWHVIASNDALVSVPAAAGLPVWRVLLSGEVESVQGVMSENPLRVVQLDDCGHTDRYVLGPREAADEVAGAVVHFRLSQLAAVEAEASALGVPVAEVRHRLRRLRSAIAAGRADEQSAAMLEGLTRLSTRMNELRLWRS